MGGLWERLFFTNGQMSRPNKGYSSLARLQNLVATHSHPTNYEEYFICQVLEVFHLTDTPLCSLLLNWPRILKPLTKKPSSFIDSNQDRHSALELNQLKIKETFLFEPSFYKHFATYFFVSTNDALDRKS